MHSIEQIVITSSAEQKEPNRQMASFEKQKWNILGQFEDLKYQFNEINTEDNRKICEELPGLSEKIDEMEAQKKKMLHELKNMPSNPTDTQKNEIRSVIQACKCLIDEIEILVKSITAIIFSRNK